MIDVYGGVGPPTVPPRWISKVGLLHLLLQFAKFQKTPFVLVRTMLPKRNTRNLERKLAKVANFLHTNTRARQRKR